MRPESRSDLYHSTLPAIQPADHTHYLQTGDISAVLHKERVGGGRRNITNTCEWLMNIWLSLFSLETLQLAHQGFIAVILSGADRSFVAVRRTAGVPQEAQ